MYHIHISAQHRLLDLKLNEVWRYRDLILLFTRRTFAVSYKQTILGPLWLFINPLLTSVTYVVLFGRIAGCPRTAYPSCCFTLPVRRCGAFSPPVSAGTRLPSPLTRRCLKRCIFPAL